MRRPMRRQMDLNDHKKTLSKRLFFRMWRQQLHFRMVYNFLCKALGVQINMIFIYFDVLNPPAKYGMPQWDAMNIVYYVDICIHNIVHYIYFYINFFTLRRKNNHFVIKCSTWPRPWTNSLDKRSTLRKMDMTVTWNVWNLYRAGSLIKW
jgi:hypothetical protein